MLPGRKTQDEYCTYRLYYYTLLYVFGNWTPGRNWAPSIILILILTIIIIVIAVVVVTVVIAFPVLIAILIVVIVVATVIFIVVITVSFAAVPPNRCPSSSSIFHLSPGTHYPDQCRAECRDK